MVLEGVPHRSPVAEASKKNLFVAPSCFGGDGWLTTYLKKSPRQKLLSLQYRYGLDIT
jgi:hypothetical protein